MVAPQHEQTPPGAPDYGGSTQVYNPQAYQQQQQQQQYMQPQQPAPAPVRGQRSDHFLFRHTVTFVWLCKLSQVEDFEMFCSGSAEGSGAGREGADSR